MRIWILIFLLFVTTVHAQQFTGGFQDFGSNFADGIYTDTSRFNGPGILGASDFTVQRALQTIDASGGTLITACQISDNFCYKFSSGILTLYMSSVAHQTWPISVAVNKLLLEDGNAILLEDGSSFILLE